MLVNLSKAFTQRREGEPITQEHEQAVLSLLPEGLRREAEELIEARRPYLEQGIFPEPGSELSERTIDFHCNPVFIEAREAVLGNFVDAKFPPLILGPYEKIAFYQRPGSPPMPAFYEELVPDDMG